MGNSDHGTTYTYTASRVDKGGEDAQGADHPQKPPHRAQREIERQTERHRGRKTERERERERERDTAYPKPRRARVLPTLSAPYRK